jgi:GNAT superfamily N-acetyltransferase
VALRAREGLSFGPHWSGVPPKFPQAGSPALELRAVAATERAAIERFYREAGYPAALGTDFVAWGAWEGGVLVGALALCTEGDASILRGPEVGDSHRHRGIGRALLDTAAPDLASVSCYCIAYAFLVRVYQRYGFRRCAADEGPEFLRRRVRDLGDRGWNVVLLVKP